MEISSLLISSYVLFVYILGLWLGMRIGKLIGNPDPTAKIFPTINIPYKPKTGGAMVSGFPTVEEQKDKDKPKIDSKKFFQK